MTEFIHKAHVYKKQIITPDWFVSEKLDGRYFLWDGGVTIGMNTKDICWANIAKDKKETFSTGLWSSLGKVVYAPTFIINQLKQYPYLLEGELYLGRGRFQECMSITKPTVNVNIESWKDIKLKIFGAPLIRNFLMPRVISRTGVVIPVDAREKWIKLGMKDLIDAGCGGSQFYNQYAFLSDTMPIQSAGNVELTFYKQLKNQSMQALLREICDAGGEGLILRSPSDAWIPKRVNTILKIKPWIDDEGCVMGYVAGKEGKTGKMLGLIGALIIQSVIRGKEVTFELSGMTDDERRFDPLEDMIPGEKCVGLSKHFPLGKKITFRYRELSDTGVPKEARYHRPYMEEE